MRALITAMALSVSLVLPSAQAQLGRRGGQARANAGNRSTTANRNFNNNANVNRNGNVNRNYNVNQNANVNRNVNVNTNYRGGCYNCNYHDSDWNWGSFAAGAAAGAVTTAAVASAT